MPGVRRGVGLCLGVFCALVLEFCAWVCSGVLNKYLLFSSSLARKLRESEVVKVKVDVIAKK